jgi:hypothetical protein
MHKWIQSPKKPLGHLDYIDLTTQRATYYSMDYYPFVIQRVTLGHGSTGQDQPSYDFRGHINQHLT